MMDDVVLMNFHLLSFQIYCDPPKYTKNSIYNNQFYQLRYLFLLTNILTNIYFY